MIELYIGAAFFLASAIITPGPNNIMIMTSGLNFGVKRTIPHMLGVLFGFPFMVVIVGFGFAQVFQSFPILHQWIKLISVFYLSYLAYRIATNEARVANKTLKKPFSFWQVVLFQWVNPKAWALATTLVSAYTLPTLDFYHQILTLALIVMVIEVPFILLWLSFGVVLQRFLKQKKQRHMFNITMAIILLLSLLPAIMPWFQSGG